MKRIVDGTTYNTDTSTALARCEYEPEEGEEVVETLYQTRGGAFFIDQETTRTTWNEREREEVTKVTNTFLPQSPEAAHKWLMTGDNEIFRNPFEDPPEAEAETDPGATIYIRVPASLKRNVENAAKAAQVSGNVWAMRCVEKCLKGMPEPIVRAWAIASIFRAHANDGQWGMETCIEALSNVTDLLEVYSSVEFGDDSVISEAAGAERYQESVRKYRPHAA